MERESLITEIQAEFRVAKLVALLGPRQSGKTTLARHFCLTLALDFLKLDRIDLVCPGAASYPLGGKFTSAAWIE